MDMDPPETGANWSFAGSKRSRHGAGSEVTGARLPGPVCAWRVKFENKNKPNKPRREKTAANSVFINFLF